MLIALKKWWFREKKPINHIIMLIGDNDYGEVWGFDEPDKQRMRDYLLGAVQAWYRDRHGEWFAARDLLGGANYYWQGTPLMPLYDYYLERSDDDDDYTVRQAGCTSRMLTTLKISSSLT